MEDLRRICESCGCDSPRTHLQSGNVVFRIKPSGVSGIAQRLVAAVESECGFRTVILTRTLVQLRAIASAKPFGAPELLDPAKLTVQFLSATPDPATVSMLSAYAKNGELIALRGAELYVYFAGGIGKSKLTPVVMERILGVRSTTRNWNTVTALVSLGEELLQP